MRSDWQQWQDQVMLTSRFYPGAEPLAELHAQDQSQRARSRPLCAEPKQLGEGARRNDWLSDLLDQSRP